MAVRIGTNISALKAQRRLGEASAVYSNTLTRLSSGQRINRPSDDAAGRAVAESLTARSRVQTRAVQNASDGIGLLNVADAAIAELSGIAQRIAELAEQAATGGYTAQQRRALDTEAQSLRDEFQRVTLSTQFNGLRVLAGDVQGLRIQVGYGTSGGIAGSVGGRLGTGEVAAPSALGIGGLSSIASVDLNGDGALDLIAPDGSGNIGVSLGNGQGAFGAVTSYISGLGGLYGVAVGDFNRDGRMDVAASGASGDISLRLGDGTGALGAATTIAVTGELGELVAADFNNDGITDLVVGDTTNSAVQVLIGNSAGGFSAPTSYTSGTAPQSIVTADFNGDGRLDIVSADRDSGSLSVLLGNGSGGFVPGAGGGVSMGEPTSITAGDFNGDGRVDVAVTNGESVEVLGGGGDGTFSSIFSEIVSSGPGQIRSADLNGDGLLDLALASFDGSTLTTLLGNGRGEFSVAQQPAGARLGALTINDFNNDGVADIAASTTGAALLFIGRTRDGINPLLPLSLRNQADARQALAPLTQKIEALAVQRGVIGAFQSRLLSATETSLSERDLSLAAAGRIRDADYAAESANLVASDIRRQASAAVLAQANLQPAVALRLLGR